MVFQADLTQDSYASERDACGVGFIYKMERSHTTITDALTALCQMEHRGACGADAITGDGAGIMTTIPRELLRQEGIDPGPQDAVAVLFIPNNGPENYRQIISDFLDDEGFTARAWRKVPVRPDGLGRLARQVLPTIEQVVISPCSMCQGDLKESQLDLAFNKLRVALTNHMKNKPGGAEFYIPSLSRKTIVYKAMTTSQGLAEFYLDLNNPAFVADWAVFHRRFSTNTVSKWPLAQPFRLVAHNGEINTLQGNLNWFEARLRAIQKSNGKEEFRPDWAGSDSSILDFAVESLVNDGDSMESAFMKLIPEAHEHHSHLMDQPAIEHFYEFFAPHQEPWDGPALVVYSDGNTLGAVLDRNGLRPARYSIYQDGTIVLASEAGINPSTDAPVVKKGRLGPGQMLAIDLVTGTLQTDLAIKTAVAEKHPYGQWLLRSRRALKERPYLQKASLSQEVVLRQQIASGYTTEDLESVIPSMVLTENEPIFSMGDDTPLAVLSARPKTLFQYFKQRFAQVTNPPIDPIRERLVMSLNSYLGVRADRLNASPELAETILLPSPVMNEAELGFIESLHGEYKWARCSMTFTGSWSEEINGAFPAECTRAEDALKKALDELASEVAFQVEHGAVLIILSDKGVDEERLAMPVLAAVGAVHHHLIKRGLRLRCSLIVETSQCWTSHQLACLLAYGAQAVVPYLAFETVRHWFYSEKTQKLIHDARAAEWQAGLDQLKSSADPVSRQYADLDVQTAQSRYTSALESGLLKIISKMGVSKLSSYIGAQIFECIGLDRDLIDLCFPGTHSAVGGITLNDLQLEVAAHHDRAFLPDPSLSDEGVFKNKRNGEFHRNNPDLVKALHAAVKLKDENADQETRSSQYKSYAQLVAQQPPSSLRQLLGIKSDRQPIPVVEVEPIEAIVEKFCTGGMSLGALSKEAHEALAVAMNRLNARSNCGEGGEDSIRYKPIQVEADGTSKDFPGLKNLRPGDSAASKIRQVASARFGVTPQYLASAEQLEIKIAQGAKPGEGGQLPAHKVSDYIARLRTTKPGISLISPPPHHDIYSIEDLAQLIYDLKEVNPRARVSVKLVSEHGIGTVALGCAKAGADIVHISGHDGGTGAAPIGSIKHAGMPWELGLSEANRFLTQQGLRDRVILRADGGLRSGEDVVKAALIGADEFAFGTIALIAQGCIMARVCHTNNCPTGIATQMQKLRERFHGSPDSVVEFFLLVADEVRYLLASMGYRSLSELRGRTDLLEKRSDISLWKCSELDLSSMFGTAPGTDFQTAKGRLIERRPDSLSSKTESLKRSTPNANQAAYAKHFARYANRSAFYANQIERSDLFSGVLEQEEEEKIAQRLAVPAGQMQPDICGLNQMILHDQAILSAVQDHGTLMKAYHIANTDRAIGANLSGFIATIHGDDGFEGQIVLNFEGSAGQSFGAFNGKNVLLILKGEANDYVGKGMHGGEIVIRRSCQLENQEDVVLAGNTCLYGATGGRMFIAGSAGERFAVRNSRAVAVVEGVGDHGCEYMTGGAVVVIGPTGRNFAAGMTGGVAYVLDEDDDFLSKVNLDCDKELYRLSHAAEQIVLSLLEDHLRLTNSGRARKILENWHHYRNLFIQVVPPAEQESAGVLADDSQAQSLRVG